MIVAPALSTWIVVEELTPKPFDEERSGSCCRGWGDTSSRGGSLWINDSSHSTIIPWVVKGEAVNVKYVAAVMSSLDVNLAQPRWYWDSNGRRKDAMSVLPPKKKGDICLKFMVPSSGNLSYLGGCDHWVQQGPTWVLAFLLHISLTELIIWRAGIVIDSGKYIHDESVLCSAKEPHKFVVE